MSKTIIVPTNAHMSYNVSKEGYLSAKGNVVVDSDKVVNVVLEEQSSVNFTINPTPSDAIVTLTADGYTQEGNSIAVDVGTNVEYNVEGNQTIDLYAWENNGTIIYTKTLNPQIGPNNGQLYDENGVPYSYDGNNGWIGMSDNFVLYLWESNIDSVSDNSMTITGYVEK